ncbi:MAG TPA: YjbH domain-containing protein [Bacteroidales bacterium]|nr:YjbH domain-containing protein [Bacteroidales bacterium]
MTLRFGKYFRLVLMSTVFILLNSYACKAQSLPGTTGYFNIPSAEIYPDRTLFVGTNLLNKEYKKWGNPDYHAMDFFVTTTFIPFVELSVRYSRMIDLPGELYKSTVGDRMASIRVRPLKEGRYHPAVVVGLQNFFTTLQSGGASHFNSTYVVLTKNFRLNTFIDRVGVTAGYGSDLFTAADYQFLGLFYGINFSPKNMDFLELMVEYDADKWNAGARVTILKHVVILAGLEGMDAFSGGISYKFQLP